MLLSLIIVAGVMSCKEKAEYKPMENTGDISVNHKVTLKEYIDGGTYGYIKVEEKGAEYWMAIPNGTYEVGGTYYYNGGMVMQDFESELLKKTFDFITFAEGIRTTEVAEMVEQTNGSHSKDDGHDHSNEAALSNVKLPIAKNGITLQTLFANTSDYANKSIIVKGIVVKVNDGIMNKNWVHIIDGTKHNELADLTITTLETVKLGDTVTFSGKVILNKDFGQGYKYDVLVEDAKLIK